GTGSASLEYDTTPPDTMVNNTPPSLTNVPSTSFTFTSTESGSTFVCTVDGTTGGCSSPFGVTAADGNHTFTVAATDAAGNVDPTPATYSWTVDTVAPDTSFTSTPDPITNQASAFALASPDPTATFECSLDGAAFTTCAANVSLGTP